MNNKKNLIVTLSALIIVLISVGILFYAQTFKTVKLTFKKDDLQVTVYKQAGENEQNAVAELDRTSDLKLQTGTYRIIPKSDQYDPAGTEFEVKDKDLAIDVEPEYSEAYRKTILSAELPAIQATINAAYPNVITNFIPTEGVIYGNGEWYATTLSQRTGSPDQEPDIYRTVLKKEGDTWIIKAKPALVLSAHEYPYIPKRILHDINRR
jgi:cytoskeletal protein RodZ